MDPQELGVDYIQRFMNSEYVADITFELIDRMIIIGSLLAVFLFILMLGWNYLKSGFESVTGNKPDSIVNYNELARTIVIVCCIFCYKPVITTVADLSNYFNSLSAPSSAEYAKMLDSKTKIDFITSPGQSELRILKADLASGKTQEPNTTIIKNRIKEIESGGQKPPQADPNALPEPGFDFQGFGISLILHTIVYTLAGTIKIVISMLAALLFNILMIVGPLALAFSILPVFRNQIDSWFSTLINTSFIATTFNILDCFHNSIINKLCQDSSIIPVDIIFVVECTMLILYLMPFWITSKYVGKGDGSRMVSKGLQMATIAAAGAMGGMSFGASGGGAAKGNNVADAVSAAKNVFTDNTEA